MTLAFGLAVALNLIYTLIQVYYAIHANSMSLLADAGHNFADVLALLLAWGANWLLTLPTTERFSYGYKRTSILAAWINALALVGTAVLIAYESIHKLFYLQDVNVSVVFWVAMIGIAVNGGTALLFAKDRHHDVNIKGAFLHLAADAVVSLSVVVGAVVIYYTNWVWLDPLLGLAIVLTIFYGSWQLLVDSTNLVLDAVPRSIERSAVNEFLLNWPGVTAIHDLHIWGLSSQDIALTAHIVIPEKLFTDDEYHQLSHALKERFHINHTTIQIERGQDTHCHHVDCC